MTTKAQNLLEEKVFERGDPLSLWWHFQILFNWHIQVTRSNPRASPWISPSSLEKASLVSSSTLGWVDVELLFINSLYVPGSILDALDVLSHVNHSPNYASDGSENLISLASLFQGWLLIPAAFNLPVAGPLGQTSSASFLCAHLSTCCIFY